MPLLVWLLFACGPEDPAPPSCDDAGMVCVVAGSGTNGFNGEDLPAADTWLFYPSALASMPDGRLVVDDFNNMLIRVLEPDGRLVSYAGNNVHGWATEGPALDSALENPVDIVVDDDGALFIAELHTARVLVVDTQQELRIHAGSGEVGWSGDGGPALDAALGEPGGIAIGSDGAIYVTDTDFHLVRRIDPDGTISTLAGHGVPGVAGDDDALEDAMFAVPQRIRADGDTLLVADSGNNAVRRIDLSTGRVTRVAGSGRSGFSGDGGPAVEAELDRPTSAIPGPDGAVWIADSGNHVVRRVDPDGTIDTIVGWPRDPGYDQAPVPVADARLQYPGDLLFDPAGDLLIADMLNGAVRKLRDPLP